MGNEMNGNHIEGEGVSTPVLSIVVPCYNEEEALVACTNELLPILLSMIEVGKISDKSNIIYIDDGSKDNTWSIIEKTAQESLHIDGIKLSCNKGHQVAMVAGLTYCIDSDMTISIDADLQDDISVIETMVDKYHQGFDVVYGVRSERKTDTFFKRFTAQSFYKLMSLMGVKQVENHADFRLLSKKALLSLLKYKEQNMYIRGLVPLIGYPSEKVFYARKERLQGESKYPISKMISLAIEGITSLSVTPLRMVTLAGLTISSLSFIMILIALFQHFLGGTVQGWTSMILVILFIGGIQMLCIGVLGEYIGKIYIETKERPKFFIEKTTK